MVSLSDLTNAMAATLGAIPELVAALAPEDPIIPYIDLNPDRNNVEKAIYQMQPGQLLVVWTETRLAFEQTSKWTHGMEIYIRALTGQSDFELIRLIMAGVPIPGDGMVWRNCPIMDGLLPTNVIEIARRTDSEGVDYLVIITETAETGDWPFP